MKRDAEVMKRAVPSMFTVAPMGRTNLFKGEEKRIWTHFETLGSTRLLVMHLKDTGRAAALGNIFVGLTGNIKGELTWKLWQMQSSRPEEGRSGRERGSF